MIISCPQCETSFSVPDEVYKPGRKARCSQCRHIFVMPELPLPDALGALEEPAAPATRKEKIQQLLRRYCTARKGLLAGVALVCLLGLCGGGYFLFSAFQEKQAVDLVRERREAREKEALQRKEQDQSVHAITLVGVRQTVVKNDRIGALVVIEGYARNDFEGPRSYIEVEAKLLDKAGKVLGEARQACGVALTLTQLQVLTLEELGKALNNPVEILSKNVDIAPKSQIPFIIVFSGVPETLYSYEVRPVHAVIDPNQI